MNRTLRSFAIAHALGFFVAAAALADSVVVNNVPYNGVRIVGVKNGELQFETAGGNLASKPLSSIGKIAINDEPALNTAEEAFARADWDKAAEGYEKTLRAINNPNKEWLREWCSARLLTASTKSGRFDVSINGFIEMARKNPDQAKAMFAGLKMPKAGSDYLKQAAASLEAEIARTSNAAASEVLLSALRDIYTANNDKAKATATSAKLVELAVKRDPKSPEAVKALLDIKLQSLRKALAAKQYAGVIDAIEKEAANINDPGQQIESLLLLADASAGKASSDPGADWKEIAVMYMRVIANANTDDPRRATALLRVAEIHADKLKDKAAAARLYRDVIREFKDTDAAKEAQKALTALER